MGLLSEYNLTDELTPDVLKELGFSESYAMPVNNKKGSYNNVYKAIFYPADTFNFNHKAFYCSYRYFPELNYLAISIEAMPHDYLVFHLGSFHNNINKYAKDDVNKRFDCIVKHYSDLLVYLTDEWVIEQVKNFKFLMHLI
jgi:hypothetical protein